MAEQKSKKKHRAAGKRSGCYSRWAGNVAYGGGPSMRKLRRIIRSSGMEEAKRHAQKHGLGALLKALLADPPKWIRRKLERAEQKSRS